MKKVLLATTALIATAGVASADITFNGMGRFGVLSTDVAGTTTTDVQNRAQFEIKGSTTSDNGMTFAGKLRLRSTNGTANSFAGAQTSVSTSGLTVYFGNIPGPLDNMANGYATTGYTGGSFTIDVVDGGGAHAYSSNGSQNALQVNYALGDVAVAVSYDKDTETTQATIEYTVSGITLAAGMQDASDAADDVTSVTIGGTFGGVTASAGYSDNGGTDEMLVQAQTEIMPGLTAEAFVYDIDGAADTGWGFGMNYGLGGGATFGVGYENQPSGNTRAEAGVVFSF